MNIWSILGLKATRDIAAIKKAYARRAAECHPEEDPRGFQVLHEAYLDALEMARPHDHGESGNKGEKPAPPPPVFRSVPGNLRKLGPGGPGDGEDAERDHVPESGETGEPAYTSVIFGPASYRFPRSGGGRTAASPQKPAPVEPGRSENSIPPGHPVNPPPSGPENLPSYVFSPPDGDQPSGEAPPVEAPEKPGEYHFPTDGYVDAPEEEAGGAPGYVFSQPDKPRTDDKPGADLPPEEAPKNDGGYHFPKGGGANEPSPGGRGGPGGSAGAGSGGRPLLVFSGFPLLESEGEMPLMPPAAGSSPAYFPQTKEEEERRRLMENARAQCLNDMQALLERKAPEQDWYPLLRGVDFTLAQYDRKFLLELLELCRRQLPLEMASALYMAYGFASDKSLQKYPAAAGLYTVLNQFLQLPQGAISHHSLSENLHKSDLVLAGLVRLSAARVESYILGQALRTSPFAQVKHQPYFLGRLAEFLRRNDGAEAWRQALAAVYQFREPPVSPGLRALAEQLPAVTEAPAEPEYLPAAADLLTDEAALPAFMAAIRERLLDMLKKTRKGFPQSTRRGPWDYVLTRPEFAPIRRDREFLTRLLSFTDEKNMPVGLWPALADAYAAEFAGLPKDEGAILEYGRDLTPEEQATACLLRLRDRLDARKEGSVKRNGFLRWLWG